MAGIAPGAIPSVFATSNGDGAVVHYDPGGIGGGISPCRRPSSTIPCTTRRPATGRSQPDRSSPRHCLACHDCTAAAALLKAMAEVRTECRPLLLCVYDVPLPAPLDGSRPTMRIVWRRVRSCAREPVDSDLARLTIRYDGTPPAPGSEAPRLPALLELARGNPAARMLRLLETLARGVADDFSMALLDGRVEVRVRPCSPAPASSN